MDEIQRLIALAFAYGLMVGGALADLVGDFLLLVTGGIALGSFGGSLYGVLRGRFRRSRSPWEIDRPLAADATTGALIGGALGLAAAVIDALIGG